MLPCIRYALTLSSFLFAQLTKHLGRRRCSSLRVAAAAQVNGQLFGPKTGAQEIDRVKADESKSKRVTRACLLFTISEGSAMSRSDVITGASPLAARCGLPRGGGHSPPVPAVAFPTPG